MTPTSLGRVNVPTPGTPVHLAATRTPCCRIRVQVVAGLTGKMYFGTSGLDKNTLAGVIKELWPNQAGGVDDSYEVWSGTDSDALDLADYWIDAAVGGEGLIVSYWNKPSWTAAAG
jgi:hypothetical protein